MEQKTEKQEKNEKKLNVAVARETIEAIIAEAKSRHNSQSENAIAGYGYNRGWQDAVDDIKLALQRVLLEAECDAIFNRAHQNDQAKMKVKSKAEALNEALGTIAAGLPAMEGLLVTNIISNLWNYKEYNTVLNLRMANSNMQQLMLQVAKHE